MFALLQHGRQQGQEGTGKRVFSEAGKYWVSGGDGHRLGPGGGGALSLEGMRGPGCVWGLWWLLATSSRAGA